MHGIRYRSDIDGLRTVAVVPVILFHLGSRAFAGGFVGVDVFFVVSGFLISGGIQREIVAGRFRLIDFYERRMRRILPALFAVMLCTLAAGWWLYLPDDYKDVGSSVTAASLFASNLLFWSQADYFTGPIDLKPLVHTWSLAVEEQFYILFPIVLTLVARHARSRFVLYTAALAALSFAVSVAMVRYAPSGAYYLLPSRAWELLLGSLLSQGAFPAVRGRVAAEAVAAIGLAAIVASETMLSGASSFPGINALWPCLGSVMVIHAGSSRHRTLVARALGFRPVLFLGLISYSLYLWHWPLIVFARYLFLTTGFSTGMMIALAAATFVVSVLSWRFVERPFRSRRHVSRRVILIGGGGRSSCSRRPAPCSIATAARPPGSAARMR